MARLLDAPELFLCEHPTTPDNITYRGGKVRCRICCREQDARGNRKHREKEKSERKWKPCLLARVW